MVSQATGRALVNRLAELVGDDNVDQRVAERRFFAQDALGRRGSTEADYVVPFAIVRPGDAQQVADILAMASESNVPVIAFGAGTGLMGGARTIEPGIVLDTIRLNRIEVNDGDRLVWAGSGAVLADVDKELREHGFCLGHDPWTFPVATVGGTLSTNSLGYKGGKYGGMGDQVVALEVALTNGTVVRTKAVRRHSSGLDYSRLFIGAEGTMGVITSAALKAWPVPERIELRGFNFDSFEEGFSAIDQMAALGLRPSLLDYGEEHASPWPDLVEREEEPPILYLGFEGFNEDVEASLTRAQQIIDGQHGRPAAEGAVEQFWENRHVVAERFARNRRQRRLPNRNPAMAFDYIHVALPASQVLTFRAFLHASTHDEGVGLMECGLWTAPECFSAVLTLPETSGGSPRLRQFIDTALQKVQDLGGAMEYVHGAGLRYSHLMAREHGPGLTVLRDIKKTMDPAGILNPGKAGL